MNSHVKYIKSFSKGQITVPKEFRDIVGVGDEFWLKVSLENGKMVSEFMGTKQKKFDYRKKLLQMPQIDIDEEELAKNRADIDKQIKHHSL